MTARQVMVFRSRLSLPNHKSVPGITRCLGGLWFVASLACGDAVDDVPTDAIARVGRVYLTDEDLQEAHAQLDAYGRRRFRGDGGRRELLASLIDAELLRQRAVADGLGDDSRVRWSTVEALAASQLAAELERREPFVRVAHDEVAIERYYRQHLDEFVTPERRGVRGVFMRRAEAADAALERLRQGEALEELGDVFEIPPASRDDREFPAFHHILFAADLRDGDLLPVPVHVQQRLMVGRVHRIEAAGPAPLDDPAVRQEVIDRLRAPRLERAKAQYLAELQQADPL